MAHQQQQQQHAPPEAFVYRSSASGGRAFPQAPLWHKQVRSKGDPSTAAAALAAASRSTTVAAFHDVPGYTYCPEAFFQSEALISRIASKIADRFPKAKEEKEEEEKMPLSQKAAAVPKRKWSSQPQEKKKAKAKGTPNALCPSPLSICLSDFAAAEAASSKSLASGFAGKRRAKKSEAVTPGTSAEA